MPGGDGATLLAANRFAVQLALGARSRIWMNPSTPWSPVVEAGYAATCPHTKICFQARSTRRLIWSHSASMTNRLDE